MRVRPKEAIHFGHGTYSKTKVRDLSLNKPNFEPQNKSKIILKNKNLKAIEDFYKR